MAQRRFLMLVAAFTLVALVLAAWFLPDRQDFHAENSSWNGLSHLTAAFPLQPLASLDGLPASPEGSALLIIPYLDFTSAELERIAQYVSGGGSLVLADDYGYGNRLLAYLGLEARFSGQVLLDPLINYKNEYFPWVVNLEPDPLTIGTDNLVFNHATSLTGVDPEDALALTSQFSFLDDNDNGTWDHGEPSGPLPVIAREWLGSSQVVLIADPSIFINGMETIGGDARFIQNIASASTSLYLDQSHLDVSELGRTRDWLKLARGVLASAPGTVLLVVGAVLAALLPVWRGKKEVSGATTFQRSLSKFLERRRP